MKSRFTQTLLAVSLGALAITASADNATPRDKPAAATVSGSNQNGTPTGTPSSTVPSGAGYGTAGAATPGTMNSPTMHKSMSDTDMRGYKEARAKCDSQSAGDAQNTCRTQLLTTWSGVDPKCQKVSGAELDSCLKGGDKAQ